VMEAGWLQGYTQDNHDIKSNARQGLKYIIRI